ALRFEGDAASAGCSLTLRLPSTGPIVGHWDPLRVDEVLTNLVANAIKYAPGKPVEVAVGIVAEEGQGDLARIVVRDQGAGIAPADQERIFRRFERASPDN